MTPPLRALAVAAIALLAGAAALANPHRLDDSASHTVPPQVQMQWRELPPGTPGAGHMEAWLRVNVRIDTRAWVGRSGRVYMVLPREEASTLEASWTTQGRLLPGRLQSGERALVFAGTIAAPSLEDQFQVRLRSAPDWQGSTRRLNFHFELDAD
jgi:hypothetical protein